MVSTLDKVAVFTKELSYIKDSRILENSKKMINMIPDYFFEVPASSTGKYHPPFAQGDGGLIRHTKAAVRIAYEILSSACLCNDYSDIDRDLVIIGLIMHDSCKYGLEKGKYTVVNHPMIAAKLIRDNKDSLTLTEDELNLLTGMIEAHMGPFNKDFKGNVLMPLPKNKYEKFVHMCDLLASKKFLDIRFNEDNEIVE
ncbi:MAG: hypothetical protein IJ565_02360 [Bacilli bacterium]|nr:hypothetical protein [Bacilli bacterium]